MRWREQLYPALAVALVAVVIVGMLQRLSLAVDFTDEAFATALPYRFALGDRPFIDEMNSAQTAGMLVTPFVWLYLKVNGSSAGIVLFTRMLFLVFKLGTGAAVFATIKRFISWPLALAISLFAVVFVPHCIPNVGYNVLGSGFFAIGSFIGVRRFGIGGKAADLFWAGLCHGLATVAYPPMVLPTLAFAAIVLVVADTERWGGFARYTAGGGLVLACILPILVHAGTAGLLATLHYGVWLDPRPPSKLFDIILAWWAHSPVSTWVIPAIAIVVAGLKARPRWALWALPLFAASLALYAPLSVVSQMQVIVYAALFAPVFLVLIGDVSIVRALFYVVWLPSCLAGAVTAFTSTNGELNGAIGFFPAAILFLVYYGIAIEKLSTAAELEPRLSPLMLAGPAVLIVSMLARFCFFVYRDAVPQELTYRVESGPFRGLYTTKARTLFIHEFEDVIRQHEDPRGKLLVYYEFPAGYLFSRMRPAGNTVWLVGAADQNALLAHYRPRITGHGLSIKIKGYPGVPPATGTTILDQFIESTGRPFESPPQLVVFGEGPR